MTSYQFSGQRKHERVLFVFRRHVMTARKGLYSVLISLIIGFIPILIWNDQRAYYIAFSIFGLGVFLLIYYYILWYFSFYIVTNERLRQIAQTGFFKKTVVDLSLNHIQSISYSVPGFFGSVFGYGTLVAQTAAGDLIISCVAHPEKVYNKLQNATDLALRKKEDEESTK